MGNLPSNQLFKKNVWIWKKMCHVPWPSYLCIHCIINRFDDGGWYALTPIVMSMCIFINDLILFYNKYSNNIFDL